MFNKYFQDELSYLRELGGEFASAYPAIAPMLAESGGDPDVERLLEGVAFLTGKLRQKIDDEIKKLVNEANSRSESLLKKNRDAITRIAEGLLDKETLTGAEVASLIEGGARR